MPFHGAEVACLSRLRPPEHLSPVMRTIFVYDGVLDGSRIDHLVIDRTLLCGGNGDVILSNPRANGAGGSRNVGLAASTASHVTFADCDDYINFESLYDIILSLGPEDILFCKSNSRFDNLDGPHSFRNASYNDAIDEYQHSGSKESLKNIYVPWSKVFRQDFLALNKIRFNEVEASNDVMFSISALVAAQSLRINKKAFYTVIDSKSSLTKNLTKSSVSSRFFELSKFNIFLRENTDWKLHPMSAQIYLCFRVSVPLGMRVLGLSIYNRFPLFYSAMHVIRILKQRGFSFLK